MIPVYWQHLLMIKNCGNTSVLWRFYAYVSKKEKTAKEKISDTKGDRSESSLASWRNTIVWEIRFWIFANWKRKILKVWIYNMNQEHKNSDKYCRQAWRNYNYSRLAVLNLKRSAGNVKTVLRSQTSKKISLAVKSNFPRKMLLKHLKKNH